MPAPISPSGSLYFDWNATTPLHAEAIEAMRNALAEGWGNPSSVHSAGRRARAIVEDAREAIARLAGVDPRDVVLTSGATEANNIALRDAPAVVTSRLEHPSIVRVAEALEAQGRPVRWLPVSPSGRSDPDDVVRALADVPDGARVALSAVNHETGVIHPVFEIEGIVRARGARLHVDASQAAAKLPPSAWHAGDTASLSAHKIRGPKAIGALILRTPSSPRPVLLGGAQERGIRPGTGDPVSAAGFGAAARRGFDGPSRYEKLAAARDELEAALGRFAEVNGAGAPRAPHVTNLSFDGWRGDELVAALDLAGICVSSGSACSAGTSEPSPVITAMVGSARAACAVRFSFGDETATEEVRAAIPSIIRVLTRHPSTA